MTEQTTASQTLPTTHGGHRPPSQTRSTRNQLLSAQRRLTDTVRRGLPSLLQPVTQSSLTWHHAAAHYLSVDEYYGGAPEVQACINYRAPQTKTPKRNTFLFAQPLHERYSLAAMRSERRQAIHCYQRSHTLPAKLSNKRLRTHTIGNSRCLAYIAVDIRTHREGF